MFIRIGFDNAVRDRTHQIKILPLLCLFWPHDKMYGKYWTVHFGWLFWIVIIHFYPGMKFGIACEWR